MKTHYVKQSEVQKNWILFDAKDQTLGRLSTEIARVLRGKNKATFAPFLDCGDNVVVINCEKVVLSGSKLKDKKYYRYSGYVGGLKSTSASEMLEKHPERIIEKAVKGMLPKNKLSSRLMKHMRVYKGTEHPHEAQNPITHAGRIAPSS